MSRNQLFKRIGFWAITALILGCMFFYEWFLFAFQDQLTVSSADTSIRPQIFGWITGYILILASVWASFKLLFQPIKWKRMVVVPLVVFSFYCFHQNSKVLAYNWAQNFWTYIEFPFQHHRIGINATGLDSTEMTQAILKADSLGYNREFVTGIELKNDQIIFHRFQEEPFLLTNKNWIWEWEQQDSNFYQGFQNSQ